MASTFGICFLCCATLTASLPPSSISPNFIPPDGDFEIIVISIDAPTASASNDTDTSAFHDAIINRFLNFQFPEFPSFSRYFSVEDLPDDQISNEQKISLEVEAENVSPEVEETQSATISPSDEGSVRTENPLQNPIRTPAFGLTNILNGVMTSLLTGFVKNLHQYQAITDSSLEVLDEDDFKAVLTDKSEPKEDTSEAEKKIDRLYLENNESENDLKHGGAPKALKYPATYTHEFRSVRSETKSTDDSEKPLKDTVQGDLSVLRSIEEPKSLNTVSKNEKTDKSDFSSVAKEELDFDRKILEILASYENEIRLAHIQSNLENTLLKKPASEDVSSFLPAAKTERPVEGQSEVSSEAMSAQSQQEEPKLINRISSSLPAAKTERPVEGQSEVSAEAMSAQPQQEAPKSVHRIPRENADDAPTVDEESKSAEPHTRYLYVPQETDAPELYRYPEGYLILPPSVENHYSRPELLTSDIVLIPAPSMHQPLRQFAPSYGYSDYAQHHTQYDYNDYSPPHSRSYPVMAAYRHPYAHYLRPQPPIAPGYNRHPFSFLQQPPTFPRQYYVK